MRSILPLFAVLSLAFAPVPPYRPKTTGPWFDGWDKPFDQLRDCRFERERDALTISVPAGGGHALNLLKRQPRRQLTSDATAPLLLRDVEGDFSFDVRVSGNVNPPTEKSNSIYYRAGVIFLDGSTVVYQSSYYPLGLGKPIRYVIERRGDEVYSQMILEG
jgi:hypothetical protein